MLQPCLLRSLSIKVYFGGLRSQAGALSDKRRRRKKPEKSKSRKVEKLSTFRLFDFSGLAGTFLYFSTFHGFSTFRASPGLFATFRLFVAFRLFDFSTFRRDFSVLFNFSSFRGLYTFQDFSTLFSFSAFRLFGLIPLQPSQQHTHTHILNKYYHKSTAAPSLRRPCRLRRVDLTYDSLNDVAGQPTDIRRRHLAIIFRPRALQISAGPKPQTPNPKP